jgi:hypothetical protein
VEEMTEEAVVKEEVAVESVEVNSI